VALEKTELVPDAGGGVADFGRGGTPKISTPVAAHRGKIHLHA
jgi:hypothetical protein